MGRRAVRRSALGFVVTLTWGTLALAQVPPGTEPGPPSGQEPGPPPGGSVTGNPSETMLLRHDHRHQVGLRVGVATGYRLTLRYRDGGDTDPCALDPSTKFCGHYLPALLDTALSFGVGEGTELEARLRLGITTDFDDSRPLQVGLGVRFYDEARDRLKLVGAFSLLTDVTTGRLRQGSPVDLIVRGELGLQYDFTRWFGFAFTAGASFGFLQNFSLLMDASLAVQFRLPP